MKKQYFTPRTECMKMEVTQMMATSDLVMGGGETTELPGMAPENHEAPWVRERKSLWDQQW